MASGKVSLLDLPTQAAVMRIAAKCIEAGATALARLEDPGDPADLHAFRVAVRRLRSLLRAYRPWLGRFAGRRLRRRLRDLTRSTNEARDADVQIAWLLERRGKLDRLERPGADWLLRRLRDRKRRDYRVAVGQLQQDFAGVVRLMKKRAGDTGAADPRDFRSAFLEVLGPGVAESRKRLAAIAGADDTNNVHRSRVLVKRLRYLVEPLRGQTPEARAFAKQLKNLQRLLGELHDVHLLEIHLASAVEDAATEKARRLHHLAVEGDEKALARARRRDESLGLVALATCARECRDALYSGLRRTWLAQRALPLQAGFEALRDSFTPATNEAPAVN
jgi:CHAD domain-containing protein